MKSRNWARGPAHVKRTLGAAHYMLYAMATLLIHDGISTCTRIMSFCVPSDPISTLPTLGLRDRSFWSFLCGETGLEWGGMDPGQRPFMRY